MRVLVNCTHDRYDDNGDGIRAVDFDGVKARLCASSLRQEDCSDELQGTPLEGVVDDHEHDTDEAAHGDEVDNR